MRGGAVWLACWAHNPEVVGSNPTPASKYSEDINNTNKTKGRQNEFYI